MICVKRIPAIQTKNFIFTQDKIIYNSTVTDNDDYRGVLLNEITEKTISLDFPSPTGKGMALSDLRSERPIFPVSFIK